MSSTPGPHNLPFARRNGIVCNVPSDQTVSECPSPRIWPSTSPPVSNVNRKCLPNPSDSRTSAFAMSLVRSRSKSTNRFTSLGESLGDSHSTIS